MSDRELGDLSACATAEAIAAGELSASECLSFWTERAGSDRLNAFLWVGSGADGIGDATGAPVAVKDIFCTEGTPTTAGSRILEG